VHQYITLKWFTSTVTTDEMDDVLAIMDLAFHANEMIPLLDAGKTRKRASAQIPVRARMFTQTLDDATHFVRVPFLFHLV
jgi:hypothetical protein